MISIETHDDVVRVHMSSFWGRRTGYTVSAYLVRGVLIDAGFARVSAELDGVLDAYVPRGAIITHWHEDHAGNVARLVSRGIPLCIDDRTVGEVRTPQRLQPYRSLVWGESPPLVESPKAFADDSLAFVHLPGHSRDHHVAWDEGTRTLFAGDLYLGVKVRISHPHEEPRLVVESLEKAIALNPRRMFCAHRGLVADPIGMLRAKATWMSDVIAQTDALTDAGAGEIEIRDRVLGREELTSYMSHGEYSRLNLVRTIRATR